MKMVHKGMNRENKWKYLLYFQKYEYTELV